ncbi:hypothetical protein Poli38472_012406 [Pythium oligandrum]|uniref:Protein kinase domain-containing protein n=1 Tax=Pythium oligandrum TaxID=41045 RepID=A0A8K1FKM8_PYTOL|nr:hypothetical protein Poli38472_012406 [Pythium oligandrum]|eukprot:TMW67290.1 hypothetical protein Poli38472_012406 [Pythium oligandrum]
MRLASAAVLGVLCATPWVALGAPTKKECTATQKGFALSTEAYDGCSKTSSFSFFGTEETDLKRFCASDDCFGIYKVLRTYDGLGCLNVNGVEELQLQEKKKAVECFGKRVNAISDSGSGSAASSSSSSSSKSKSSSGSGSGGGKGSKPSGSGSGSSLVPITTPPPTNTTTAPPTTRPPSSDDSKTNGDDGTVPVTYSPTSAPTPTKDTSSESGLNTGVLIGMIGGGVGVVAVVGAGMFVCCKRRQMQREQEEQAHQAEVFRTPGNTGGGYRGAYGDTGSNTHFSASNSNGGRTMGATTMTAGTRTAHQMTTTYGTNKSTNSTGSNLSDDETINAVRIPFEKVVFGQLISRGGYGEVYRGQYRGEVVAVKTLLPERRKDMRQIENFLAEVKLMSTMEHERIVRFIGVAWDSLNEVCVVTEFLERGDLRSVLSEFQKSSSHELGFDADKVKIALHVAHALTYMHSLQPAVMHRDLKSRNILLDNELNAKLTDFGVSRERDDRTMTAGVGSSLWMAPEVMMGERYDEKADVFSFGVVLSELDSHELPYAHAVEPGTGRKLPDTAVLQMVALGKIQVEFVHSNESEMAQLGLDCVQVDPDARPTAAQVLYRIHQMWRSHQQL